MPDRQDTLFAPAGTGSRLIIPALGPVYDRLRPLSYAVLRISFGLIVLTHGIPKITGTAHGSNLNPFGGAANMIETVMHLPFAYGLAWLITLLETFGAVAVTLGLGTRLFASMFVMEMLGISYALGPTFNWGDHGMEYPLFLAAGAFVITAWGGGVFSIDRWIGREL